MNPEDIYFMVRVNIHSMDGTRINYVHIDTLIEHALG